MKGCHFRLVVLIGLFVLVATPAKSQDNWKLSGQFFGDYQMMLQAVDPANDGDNAFQIRRIFFTADFPLSESIDGRFRVESTNRNVIEGNRSVPFLKDVYLRWKNVLGPGHNLIIGLSAPPMWQVSQRFWSYRALARTVQHRAGIAGPRDTGVALYGPVGASGNTRYGVMIGNDNQGAGDTDKAKHLYSQIDTDLSDHFIAAVGMDYRPLRNGHSYNGSLLLGWHEENNSRVATEIFFDARPMDDPNRSDAIYGASVYGWHHISEQTKIILRGDLTHFDIGGEEANRTWVFAGVSYSPEKDVEIIPNIGFDDDERNARPEILARLTLYANF